MKTKQYSLESKEDWRITFEWGTEFITSLLILLRLVSLWALYTLKWTLVLMGHYLTYESLRHNQLPFTFKDHLSDGHLSFLPLLPRCRLRSANDEAYRALGCVWPPLPSLPPSVIGVGSCPPGGWKEGSLGSPCPGPSTLSCLWDRVCNSPRELRCLPRWIDSRETAASHLTFHSLCGYALWATKGASQTSASIRVHKKGSMLSQTKSNK